MNKVKIKNFEFWISDPTEHIQKILLGGHLYEEEMIEFIQGNYAGGTFVDIGAFIGTHSIPFSKLAGQVVAFEPLSLNNDILVKNIALNKISNIIVYPIALGSEEKTVELFVPEKGKVSSLTRIVPDARKWELACSVPVKTLDSFNLQDVRLIKVDVENYEVPVLMGAMETIKRCFPDFFIECSNIQRLKDVQEILFPLGYHLYPKVFNATPTYLFFRQKHK